MLRLAEALNLPLRARNDLLAAAGLAAEFPESELSSPGLSPYRGAVLGVITALDPFPAFVLDSTFHVVAVNTVGARLLPPSPQDARLNLIDAFLAPGPARNMIRNFAEVAWSLHTRFVRATASIGTPEVDALRTRVAGYLEGVPRPPADASGEPVVCPTFQVGDRTVRTIGMTLRFGPSRDVTLEELTVDVLCPRDEEAARFFRELGGPARDSNALSALGIPAAGMGTDLEPAHAVSHEPD